MDSEGSLAGIPATLASPGPIGREPHGLSGLEDRLALQRPGSSQFTRLETSGPEKCLLVGLWLTGPGLRPRISSRVVGQTGLSHSPVPELGPGFMELRAGSR